MSYFVFDGVDGAGKTSLIEALEKRLIDDGNKPARFSFPGNFDLGDMIRRGWAGAYPSASWPLMHLAEQVARDPSIVDQVDLGTTILCDRHVFTSGPAYAPLFYSQTMIDELRWMLPIIKPALIFIVTVDPYVALRRLQARPGFNADVMENTIGVSEIRTRAACILECAEQWVGRSAVIKVSNNDDLVSAVRRVWGVLRAERMI
jgi:thymidylate kinase